jgi:hypothetical protein
MNFAIGILIQVDGTVSTIQTDSVAAANKLNAAMKFVRDFVLSHHSLLEYELRKLNALLREALGEWLRGHLREIKVPYFSFFGFCF